MGYNIDMNGEDYSNKSNPEYDAGYYEVKIGSVLVKESKKIDENTNQLAKYFEWSLVFMAGPYVGKEIVARTTAIKGKRWLLKSALESFGVAPKEGKYAFDIEALCGKTAVIKIDIKEEKWVSKKDGNPRTSYKSVVSSFMKAAPQGVKLNNVGEVFPDF